MGVDSVTGYCSNADSVSVCGSSAGSSTTTLAKLKKTIAELTFRCVEHKDSDVHSERVEHKDSDVHSERVEHKDSDVHSERVQHKDSDVHSERVEHRDSDVHSQRVAMPLQKL